MNRYWCRLRSLAKLHQSSPFIFQRKLSSNLFPIGMDGRPSTAGIIIIGDEIIKGQVQDSNSFFLCQRLHHLGVTVKSVLTIPDDKTTISKHVKEYSSLYTYVITAGGIGPTHDDITYDAVANAFGVETALNGEIESIYRSYFKDRFTDTHRKLAMVPETAELVKNKKNMPVVRIDNVFILPGVPKFLRLAFAALEELMRDPSVHYQTRAFYLDTDEMSITNELTAVNESFKNSVMIGSYPEWHNNYYKVRITLESTDETALDDCERELKEKINPNLFVPYDSDPMKDPWQSLMDLLDDTSPIKMKLEETVAIYQEALERYSPHEICIGFNGGKDCTALLHIWFAVTQHYGKSNSKHPSLQSLYIRSRTPFPEMETFIEDCIIRYGLEMLRFEGTIKEQLAALKLRQPQIKAVIMGTRSSDPHGKDLKAFHPTDEGWPEFMRINPILNWSYNDIWYFLRKLCLSYCSLYDVGYTSLGSMENTHPNPALRYIDRNNIVKYRPAYTLQVTDDQTERAGRTVFKL